MNMRTGRLVIAADLSGRRSRFHTGFPEGRFVRFRAWGVAFLVHAVVAAAVLWDWPETVVPPPPAKPIEVSLMEAARPPQPVPPRPKPVSRPRSAAPAPVVAERAPVVPEPQPVAVAPVVDQPVPAAVQVAAPVMPAPRPVAPEPLVEARFDADYLTNPKPPYPRLSRRLGEEGVVRLRVHVGPEGQVLRIELKDGSGYPRLDQSALDTVARWHFVPARRGTVPVASWVVVPIVFSLT
jgi:protein TonB